MRNAILCLLLPASLKLPQLSGRGLGGGEWRGGARGAYFMTGTRCGEKQDANAAGLEHVGGGVSGSKADFQRGKKRDFLGGNGVKNVPSSHPDRLESREETRAAAMRR